MWFGLLFLCLLLEYYKGLFLWSKCIHYTDITTLNIRKRKSKNYWLTTHMFGWDLIFFLLSSLNIIVTGMHVPRKRGSKTWCNRWRNHKKQYQGREKGVKQLYLSQWLQLHSWQISASWFWGSTLLCSAMMSRTLGVIT